MPLPLPPDGDSTWELLLYLARLTLGWGSAARVPAVLLLLLISRASGDCSTCAPQHALIGKVIFALIGYARVLDRGLLCENSIQ